MACTLFGCAVSPGARLVMLFGAVLCGVFSAHASPFVAPGIPAPTTLVLDARGDAEAFARSHLAGAQLLPVSDWFDTFALSGTRAEPWMARFAALGILPDRPVLIYDSGGYSFAAFARLMLVGFGVRHVEIVQGGFPALQRELAAGNFVAGAALRSMGSRWLSRWDSEGRVPQLVDYSQVLAQSGDGGAVLLDVRSPEEFAGSTASDNPREGHVPGAVNLPKALWVQPDGQMLSATQIDQLLAPLGIHSRDQPLTVYCQGGGRSAFVATVLHAAGYSHVRNYAGSWHDWSRRPELPLARERDSD